VADLAGAGARPAARVGTDGLHLEDKCLSSSNDSPVRLLVVQNSVALSKLGLAHIYSPRCVSSSRLERRPLITPGGDVRGEPQKAGGPQGLKYPGRLVLGWVALPSIGRRGPDP